MPSFKVKEGGWEEWIIKTGKMGEGLSFRYFYVAIMLFVLCYVKCIPI
jgi:hypothetical protein